MTTRVLDKLIVLKEEIEGRGSKELKTLEEAEYYLDWLVETREKYKAFISDVTRLSVREKEEAVEIGRLLADVKSRFTTDALLVAASEIIEMRKKKAFEEGAI